MTKKVRAKPSSEELIQGVRAGDRMALSKAITLIESQKPEDQPSAMHLVDSLNGPHQSLRIGVSGVPGAGKSTFIEALALTAITEKKKVAVLSVDPSSSSSKGSILGDKTRMTHLSRHPDAFIRPSPAGNHSGGVSGHTREAILVCEAAGFDVIIVETVGVGQAETMVKNMVDYFLVLMLAGAGDELQGIKRGIMELADGIVINKSDGDNINATHQARKSIENALHYFPPTASGTEVHVSTCSAILKEGIKEIWEVIKNYHERTKMTGYHEKNRQNQNIHWMHEMIQRKIKQSFYEKEGNKARIDELSKKILNGDISVRLAVDQLF